MFSSMLQSLLSSSGKANAMQRAVQMNNYVNKYNDQWTPVSTNNQLQQTNANPVQIQSFDSVLKKSATVKFGDLLTNPTTRVNASLYTAQAGTTTDKLSPRQKIKDIH